MSPYERKFVFIILPGCLAWIAIVMIAIAVLA